MADEMRHYSAALFYLFAAILPAAALAGPDVPGTKKEPIAQGIQRICVEGPGHKWTCDGIEVDLHDPLVAIETIPAERLAGRRETVSQIASLRERSGRSVIAVAGCDDPDENGLPDGLLIENSDLGSAPNEHPSFILTANGRAMIGRFLLSATAELQSGTTFPIKRFNRTPKPGESALLSYRFGPLPDLPGLVGADLDDRSHGDLGRQALVGNLPAR